MVDTVRYATADRQSLVAVVDGHEHHFAAALLSPPTGAIGRRVAQWLAAGHTPEPYGPPSPTAAHIDAERDRRMAELTFQGHSFNCDATSLRRIETAKTTALAAIINGAQPGNLRWADEALDFAWITRDNARVLMDAQTCLAFGLAAASWEGRHILAARALKDLGQTPSDYASNPAYWPRP